VAAEEGKVDPMKQFMLEPLFGSEGWELAGFNIAFTNSALWMAITVVLLWAFAEARLGRLWVVLGGGALAVQILVWWVAPTGAGG